MSDVTLMLQAIGRGDKQASEELLPLVYGELRRMAAARMAGRRTATHGGPPNVRAVNKIWRFSIPDSAFQVGGLKTMESSLQQEARVFSAASEVTDVAERRALLDRACEGDKELRAAVEELLAVRADAEEFFTRSSAALVVSGTFYPENSN